MARWGGAYVAVQRCLSPQSLAGDAGVKTDRLEYPRAAKRFHSQNWAPTGTPLADPAEARLGPDTQAAAGPGYPAHNGTFGAVAVGPKSSERSNISAVTRAAITSFSRRWPLGRSRYSPAGRSARPHVYASSLLSRTYSMPLIACRVGHGLSRQWRQGWTPDLPVGHRLPGLRSPDCRGRWDVSPGRPLVVGAHQDLES